MEDWIGDAVIARVEGEDVPGELVAVSARGIVIKTNHGLEENKDIPEGEDVKYEIFIPHHRINAVLRKY